MAKKSVISGIKNSKIGEGVKSIVDVMRDSKTVTFNTVNEVATSGANKYASAINKRVKAGDTRALGGLIELQTPSRYNAFTGVKVNKKADLALASGLVVGTMGLSAFESSNLYEEYQKHESARSNEISTSAPHSDLGRYDMGVTNASGIGYGVSPTGGRVYGSSRDYSLGATGDLTLGLHKARRRRT